MKSEGLEVKFAALHGLIFIPGIGQLGNTLEMNNANSKIQSMTLYDTVLMLTVKDKVGKVEMVSIPLANVTHAVLARK